MATQTEVVTVTATSEEQAGSDTVQEENGSGQNKENWLRRRFNKKNGDKSRKPPGNKWLQQQIPACRPVFSATHVAIAFIIIGIVFLAMGIAFTVVSMRLREYEFSYTDCESYDRPNGFARCEDYLTNISGITNDERRTTPDCHCTINVTIPQSLRPPWNIYYGMRNYYQNHRRYISSWDIDQLRSSKLLSSSASSDCRPLVSIGGKPIVPCGLIANSWFNDSFDYFFSADGQSTTNISEINRSNIAWDTDRTIRFRNPRGDDSVNQTDLINTVRPPNWPKDLSEIPGGLTNESLIVWFRLSAFPLFRKLYGRAVINGGEPGRTELPAGVYSLNLTYNYPVTAFNGQKFFVLAEVSVLGGRNLFLGIAYIVTACVLIIAAVMMLIVHLALSRWKTTDRRFLDRKY